MKRRIFVATVLALLLVGTMSVSAQQTIFAAYNKPGNVNLDVVGGYGGWLGVGVDAEVIIGKFDLGSLPFQWGVMGAGIIDFPFFEIGAGAMATLHLGLIWNLDFFIGLGVGADFYGGFGVGFAETSGVAYKLSNNFTVLLSDTWLDGAYVYGVGIQLKL
jgi:hypothetical protein